MFFGPHCPILGHILERRDWWWVRGGGKPEPGDWRRKERGAGQVVLLQLVQVVVKSWDALFQALAFAGVSNHLRGFGGRVRGVALKDLPVVKHTLGEGLAPGVGAKVSGEA